jgi:SAM-dependent methyltransferase
VDEAFWDERYRSAPQVWSGKPNPHLVTDTAELTPGVALDVGAGEGADSIWLAEQGWQVTAVEWSHVARERGQEQARERGASVADRITWLHADLTVWEPPTEKFDLVSVHFMHLPSSVRTPMYRRLAAAVAPGGILLVVGHHPSDLDTGVRRPGDPDLLFTADALAEDLGAGWSILARDARPRGAVGPDGESVTVHDAVLRARRSDSTG